MDKQHILDEIRRTAEANGGKPLGVKRFHIETGIRQSDWYAKYWRNYGEAVREAGYEPNQLQRALAKTTYLRNWFTSSVNLGDIRLPRIYACALARIRISPARLCSNASAIKIQRAQKIIEYCRTRDGFEDVVEICEPIAAALSTKVDHRATHNGYVIGYVYLLKSGRFCKIGRANSAGRRAMNWRFSSRKSHAGPSDQDR